MQYFSLCAIESRLSLTAASIAANTTPPGHLQAFNATLRSEVDFNQLREQLVAVVEETMQPAHVSLWLSPLNQRQKQNTGV